MSQISKNKEFWKGKWMIPYGRIFSGLYSNKSK